MAVDSTTQLTLLELVKRTDPKGDAAKIAEILNDSNPIIQDAVWMEANDTFSHTYVQRGALPSGSWRNLNDGVANESSQTIRGVEGIGMLESYSEVDKVLVDAAPNPAQFRMDEARSFIEGMGQTFADTMFNGNSSTAPETFTGLLQRLNTLQTSNPRYVIGAGGSSGTSVFVVQWGIGKTFMVYPKGHPTAGISHENLGQVTLSGVTSSTQFEGYRDHFKMYGGLVVQDPRTIGRIPNIEISGAANLFDEDLLIELLNWMPNSGAGAMIYVPPIVKTQMEIRLKDKTNVNFAVSDGLGGVPVMTFRGLQVKACDAISTAETTVT